MTEEDNYKVFHLEDLKKIADFIKNKVSTTPKLLIICGSGLGGLADTLEDPISLKYEDIPNFPVTTVEGHAGELIFGKLSNVQVVCMKGRFHYFEGYPFQKITMPIRVMKLLGIKGLIVTNAAGGVNAIYKTGDIMVIKDHFNFFDFGGLNPLRGPNEDYFGDRFFPTGDCYDKELIEIARGVAKEVGLGDCYREGVYAIHAGPSYGTVVETRAMQMLGVDAVGMSTIPEVLVARHCGLAVLGFSFITNPSVTTYDDSEEPTHAEVLAAVRAKSEQLKAFVSGIVDKSQARWMEGETKCGVVNESVKVK